MIWPLCGMLLGPVLDFESRAWSYTSDNMPLLMPPELSFCGQFTTLLDRVTVDSKKEAQQGKSGLAGGGQTGVSKEAMTFRMGTNGKSGYYPTRPITSDISFFAELTSGDTS